MASSARAVLDFHQAVDRLAEFAGRNKTLLVQNFGVGIAVMAHRADPTRAIVPTHGRAAKSNELQMDICDPTWRKDAAFLPPGAEGPIYKPFTKSFKPISSSQNNNWRNSFNIQGGLGCNAPLNPSFFQSEDYVAEHRFDCHFRDDTNGLCAASSKKAHCFAPRKKGEGLPAWAPTKASHRPKLLRIATPANGEQGYWSVEPTVASLADLLGSTSPRVPAADFATALFAGSTYWPTSTGDSIDRLQKVLALDDERFLTLFERDRASGISSATFTPAGGRLLTHPSGGAAPYPSSASQAGLAPPVDYVQADVAIIIHKAGTEPDPERRRRLLEHATRGHRRILNTLAAQLRSRGFRVQEQAGGYDLHAFDGDARHVLFEAKTWHSTNLASQIRAGWAQLEEYAYRNQNELGYSPELVLALNHRPPADFWAWEWFAHRGSPHVIWLEGDFVNTLPADADWLSTLL